MKVTTANYQILAERTMASKGSQAADGAHMAMGITTELGELKEGIKNNNFVNIREEHGDCMWYISNTCNIYGWFFESFIDTRTLTEYVQPFKLHDLVDLHKREFAYGKEMDREKLHDNIVNLMAYLLAVEEENGFTIEESLELNIKKLAARYGDKFSEFKALNRDLDKEYKILKG